MFVLFLIAGCPCDVKQDVTHDVKHRPILTGGWPLDKRLSY